MNIRKGKTCGKKVELKLANGEFSVTAVTENSPTLITLILLLLPCCTILPREKFY